ncbi:LGFP repeat-containing protein [Paenibacillus sp. B1-33]|uniref:LGFP repeat-containing protein n=1 Tax=unclassified Paenibacillus TaxID=185978 RepID=UPI003D29351A
MTIIDFDDLPSETYVQTQYADRGVVFPNGAYIEGGVLRAAKTVGVEFPAQLGPLIIDFTSPQRHVRFYASTTLSNVALNGTLRALNASGVIIAQDGPKLVAPYVFTTAFEVNTPSSMIVRVEFEMDNQKIEAINNLEFEGEPPGPLPTNPPVVRITSPATDAQLEVMPIIVTGEITGEGLLPMATLKLTYRLPPDSTAPPFSTLVQLSGSGSTRFFLAPLGLSFLGPQEITIEAQNIAGLTGSSTVHFTYFPQQIRSRYASEGGLETFGDFRWSSGDDIAIYERGAICASENTSLVILGQIFTKWLSITGRLGRPTSEERDAPGGTRAQDFRKGRIYSGATGTYYVPSIFVQAIDQLGGEIATGLPIADPRASLATETWQFQQFARPNQPGLPSTLEIKGSPSTLWVERQGGDLSELADVSAPLAEDSPTLWLQFPCNGTAETGLCNIVPPTSAPPIENAGLNYCGGSVYRPWNLGGPPEWKAIDGNYVLTPMLGIVKNFELAEWDNPLTHEYSNDWVIPVRPLHPYRNLLADNHFLMEIETEAYFLNYYIAEWGSPLRGDLLFVSGRWIIDCGHSPYNSEIHPPSILAFMRTGTHYGKPATVATVFVLGFYTGDPVEIDIFPPPRPSPDATIVAEVQMGGEGLLDVTMDNTLVSSSIIRLRFTASPRRVPVTDAGEMKWQNGRGGSVRWYVYWTESSGA